MCPPVLFEDSTDRLRFSVGDETGDVAQEIVQTDEGEVGALLESDIGLDCFFTNISIMFASNVSRVF